MTESHIPLVDINRASLEELVSIRGIGQSLAMRIIENRPYHQVDDLVKVPGINTIKLSTLLPYITVVEKKVKHAPTKAPEQPKTLDASHMAKFGNTETFVFLEDRNERQDALLIIFGGFIIGLIILLLRRSRR